MIGLLLALAAAPAPATPDDIALYLMEVPPLTVNAPEHKGVVGDIVLEALRRAGYQPRLIVVPNNRALTVVGASDARDTLIIPLARIEEREAVYTWIAPLAKVNRAFFSLNRSVHSFEEARAGFRQVGVARGTAGVNILRREGFPDRQVYEINQGEAALKMLLMGRIDAWYGPVAEGKAMLKAIDAGDKAVLSTPLGASLNYLGCSRLCDPAIVARLQKALRAMELDGSTREIRQKYGELD